MPAETEAVGVPEFMLRTANLASLDAVPPMAKSTVELFAKRRPEDWSQKESILP